MIAMKIVIYCLAFLIIEFLGNPSAANSDLTSYDSPLKPNSARVGPHYVEMPLNKIFLVRGGKSYCAIKFTRFWTGWSENNLYASYESWYMDNVSDNYFGKNAKYEISKASSILFGIGRFSFNFGNEEIRCGPFRLWWWGKGMVYFFAQGQGFGDYGIEIAPTSLSGINKVNVFDPHLKWYRYDMNRLPIDIPLDEIDRFSN